MIPSQEFKVEDEEEEDEGNKRSTKVQLPFVSKKKREKQENGIIKQSTFFTFEQLSEGETRGKTSASLLTAK